LFPFPWPIDGFTVRLHNRGYITYYYTNSSSFAIHGREPGFCKRGRLFRSDLVLELVALDDGVGARDGVAAGGPEVERARVALRVPVHAAEGGAAPACESRQSHALPAARAPPARRRRRRGRGVGRGRGRHSCCVTRRRRLEDCRRRGWLLLPVAIALGAEVHRSGAAEEAAVVGAQAVAVLPPLLLRHGVGEGRKREREVGRVLSWSGTGLIKRYEGWSVAFD
jgi:hypothetical protein